MKQSVESKIRNIIREELDYYFSKLEKSLTEMYSNSKPNVEMMDRDIRRPKTKTPDFKKKFGSLMSSISEGIDMEPEDTSSILSDNVLNSLEKDYKFSGVHKALTKDYSKILNKIEDIKSNK